MNRKEGLSKAFEDHCKIHDNVTVESILLKDENPQLSPEVIQMWEGHIMPRVYWTVADHMAHSRWNKAIKGLLFIRKIENLILTQQKKSE